jgi:hypothetical protein
MIHAGNGRVEDFTPAREYVKKFDSGLYHQWGVAVPNRYACMADTGDNRVHRRDVAE